MVARMGGAIAAIALLAVLGMSVSSMVALSTRGSGEAINLAGSLRMQSWKIASLYLSHPAAEAAGSRSRMRDAITGFEATLSAQPILDMLPGSSELDLAGSYVRVRTDWERRIRPRFMGMAEGRTPLPDEADEAAMLAEVGAFVAAINDLVKQMELATEAKIKVMQMVLGVALVFTVLVVLLTVYLIHTGLVQPLRALLAFASRVGQGDLSVRTPYSGDDELGRLGQAFNAMAEDLSKLYADLEERVREKTAELTRSNQSLELLYHSIARLHGEPPRRETFLSVLDDIESVLGFGHGLICLSEVKGHSGRVLASTIQPGEPSPCIVGDCIGCHRGGETRVQIDRDHHQHLTLPLADPERQYGVLIIEIPDGHHLESWQVHLLEALSRHIGVAIGAERRIEQSRRLAPLEERAVIARELHDSLAQSLAYMKIQVSRLKSAIRTDSVDPSKVDGVLEELHEGLNSAYRQLRELLSSFRLTMENAPFSRVLEKTIAEFGERGGLEIGLRLDMEPCRLSPNEEIHLLHIVREALANVLHHARARHAWVMLGRVDEGRLRLSVEDDGGGIVKPADVHHYGMTIMEERARILRGQLRFENRAEGGARVVLEFIPGSHAQNEEGMEEGR